MPRSFRYALLGLVTLLLTRSSRRDWTNPPRQR
jgi:hypothetical protein